MAVQNIRRARTYVTFRPEAPEWFRRFMTDNYVLSTAQLNALQTAFQQLWVAVPAGATSAVVTLPFPYDDEFYAPRLETSWATSRYITAISRTAFTVALNTAAPLGGGTLYVTAIR
jgi:hypothetical protein